MEVKTQCKLNKFIIESFITDDTKSTKKKNFKKIVQKTQLYRF